MQTSTIKTTKATPQKKTEGTPITNRWDGSIFLTATMSNPQGDPDADNYPRTDPLTGRGLITPMGLRRHVRDYIQAVYGLPMWVTRKVPLGAQTDAAAQKAKIVGKAQTNTTRLDAEGEVALTKALGDMFWDCRAFGGVQANYESRITGPLQVGMGTSVDPIDIVEMTNTLCTVASVKDSKNKDRDFGKIAVVRFGLYRFDFSLSPAQAKKTGFCQEDLVIFLEAVLRAYEFSASTMRSAVAVQRIDLFKHDTALGDEPKHRLVERVQVKRVGPLPEAEKYGDYEVTVDTSGLKGVQHHVFKSFKDLEGHKAFK